MVRPGGQPAEGGAPEFRGLLQVGGLDLEGLGKPLRDSHILGHEGMREAGRESPGEHLLRDLALGGAVLSGRSIDHVDQGLRIEAEFFADQQRFHAGGRAGRAEVVVQRLGGMT